MTGVTVPEISLADVSELALENFLLRRDNQRLREMNAELRQLLDQAAAEVSAAASAALASSTT